jgi:hypothetical protein
MPSFLNPAQTGCGLKEFLTPTQSIKKKASFL